MAEAPFRLFIAAPVPPAALAECRALLDAVRAEAGERGARWVRTENLHLTLRFLGEVAPDRVPELEAAVRSALVGQAAFGVVLAGAGAFPSDVRPRAVWLGIESGAERLGALVRALDGPLAELGWPADGRAYRPHLTVGRTDAVPHATGAATAAVLTEAARAWRVEFPVDRVALLRSHLGASPPRYQTLTEVELAGEAPPGDGADGDPG